MKINKWAGRSAVAAVAIAATVLGFGVSAVAASTAIQLSAPNGLSAADSGYASAPMGEPDYAVNASGETYGSALLARSSDEEPDLIQAVTTDGIEGYVRKSELDAVNGSRVKSPEEALAWQAGVEGKTFHVPVYAVDGKTVLGQFEVAPGDARQ